MSGQITRFRIFRVAGSLFLVFATTCQSPKCIGFLWQFRACDRFLLRPFPFQIVGFKAWKKKPVESDNDTKSAKQTSSLEGSAADSATKDQGDGEPNDSNVLMKRLLVVLTACFFTATAMTSFGFTSFKVIHGLHATMITVEVRAFLKQAWDLERSSRFQGVSLLVRSLYVTYRVAWWHAVRDAAVRESVPFQKRLYTAKRITDVLIHSFSSIQYALYLVGYSSVFGAFLRLYASKDWFWQPPPTSFGRLEHLERVLGFSNAITKRVMRQYIAGYRSFYERAGWWLVDIESDADSDNRGPIFFLKPG